MRNRLIGWVLALVFLTVILSGCDGSVDITPVVDDTTYHVIPVEVFSGTLDAKKTDFETDLYTCNPVDLFVYRLSDNGAILNADSTQAWCHTRIFTRTDLTRTDVPLYTE